MAILTLDEYTKKNTGKEQSLPSSNAKITTLSEYVAKNPVKRVSSQQYSIDDLYFVKKNLEKTMKKVKSNKEEYKRALETYAQLKKDIKEKESQGEKQSTIGEKILKTTASVGKELGTGVLQAGEGIIEGVLQVGSSKYNPYYWFDKQALEGNQQIAQELIEDDMTKTALYNMGYGDKLSSGKTVQEELDKGPSLKSDSKAANLIQGIGSNITSAFLGSSLAGGIKGTTKAAKVAKEIVEMLPFTATSYGSSLEEAYLGGADREIADKYAKLNTLLEVATEKLYSGAGSVLKIGGAVDDVLTKKLTSKITSSLANKLVTLGIGALAEGGEEIVSAAVNPLLKAITYMSPDDLKTLYSNVNLLDAFIGGAVGGLVLGSGSVMLDKTKTNQISDDSINKLQTIINTSTNKEEVNVAKKIIDNLNIADIKIDEYTNYKNILEQAKEASVDPVEVQKIDEALLEVDSYINELNTLNKKTPESVSRVEPSTKTTETTSDTKLKVTELKDNYLKPLKTYANKMYRETDVDRTLSIINPRSITDMTLEEVYMSNNPDLALGQGTNKGIVIKFNSGDLLGKVNTTKPSFAFNFKNGDAEFIARNNTQSSYRDAVESITIPKGTSMSQVQKTKLQNTLKYWNANKNPDGSTTYTKPKNINLAEKKISNKTTKYFNTLKTKEKINSDNISYKVPEKLYKGVSNDTNFKDTPKFGVGEYSTPDLERAKGFGKVSEVSFNAKNPYIQGTNYNQKMIDILNKYKKQNPLKAEMIDKVIKGEIMLNKSIIPVNLITKFYKEAGYDGFIGGTSNTPEYVSFVSNIKKDVPTSKNIRAWSKTIDKSDALNQENILEAKKGKDFTFTRASNASSIEKANKTIRTLGYEGSLKQFHAMFESNSLPKASDIALGEELLIKASQMKDSAEVSRLVMETSIIGTELGQATQALSLINKLTPEGQLKMLQRTINRMKVNTKGAEGLHLTDQMINKVLDSSDQQDLYNNIADVEGELAKQLKPTMKEKIKAWRYLAMLGNPKTHIRNIVSNIAMGQTVKIKNVVARAIETAVDAAGGFKDQERSKTFKKATTDVQSYVKEYYESNKDQLSGISKYSTDQTLKRMQKTLGDKGIGKWAQALYEFNNNALGFEDDMTKIPVFLKSMSEYLTANGVKSQKDIEASPNLVKNAAMYATDEALKATFQQFSAFAAALEKASNIPAVGIAVEALIPFKKTPINVIKTGVNYSPLGLLKTLTLNSRDLHNKTISVSQYIDNISQGLTGSGIMYLGYLLAKMGILSGGEDEDKESKYLNSLGVQAYSINVGGKSFTIDWLTPVSIPLLIGAEVDRLKKESGDTSINNLIKSSFSAIQPVIELSFLQGVNSMLEGYAYTKLNGAFENLITNYVGQFFPTIGAQISKTIDPTVRSTSYDKSSGFTLLDKIERTVASKIPGANYLLEPSIDLHGDEVQRSNNIIERAVENFIAPYSKKEDISNNIDIELKRLYSSTGLDKVIPNTSLDKYFKYNNEQYNLSAKEYTEYKKDYGTTSYELLDKLINNSYYNNASDGQKSALIEKVYEYANEIAKKQLLETKGVTYTNSTYKKEPIYKENAIKDAIENSISYEAAVYKRSNPTNYNVVTQISDYDTYNEYNTELNSIRQNTSEDKEETIKYIKSLPLTKIQKIIYIKSKYSSFKNYDDEIIKYVKSLNLTLQEKKDILINLDIIKE